ncbi:putative RNA recognition motif domain, nucleotide-binding alpha-beta plait domain superfamily [Helianthus annuus]|nr:putative RNA recognition motif domain, nucleotide-binding alpha-beta plait domain superfamily [Helianthus annuus]KAJ0479769.1 putative RNA recognition motif domain, nucleotide-binding alpha-beta plait domain superfamily [Helianthus annuus]KAJ0662619.1 putative RNA recognition motif domain, nucleotide-binding alpha-beta plait domain superfamily [Helianthus annuus]KAJ0670137.1 putative RNA recognition motif domain, nucleotide-binding alpha-beta plait domain superfamily [Helianthus annuus]KAJ08
MGNPNRRGGNNRSSFDTDDPATRTTFYVTDISDRVTGMKLREAFSPFVYVTDAWVPRRRSSKGKVFGFVRCQKIKDPYPILQNLNDITIMESQISVSLALFDRAHKKIPYVNDEPVKKVWMPREKNVVDADFPPITLVYCGSSGSKKSLYLDDGEALYPAHCIGRVVVGRADSIGRLHSVKKMLAAAGFVEAAVSYVGGLSVLISFRDRGEMDAFLKSKEDVWKDTFVSVTPWTGQDFPFERIAVLKIMGLPIAVRDGAVYDKVGNLIGKVVWPSEFSWLAVDNSVGFSHVITRLPSRIDEEVAIRWRGSGIMCGWLRNNYLGCLSLQRSRPPELWMSWRNGKSGTSRRK